MRSQLENDKKIEELKKQMAALAERAANNENVDREVMQLKDRMDRLNKDRGDIEAAGMV